MTRLYLVPHDRYRVRMLDGRITLCTWDDAACGFVTGRGQQRRVIDPARIAAVSPFAHIGRCAIRWTPFADCYRAKWKPATPQPVWRHPYARRVA